MPTDRVKLFLQMIKTYQQTFSKLIEAYCDVFIDPDDPDDDEPEDEDEPEEEDEEEEQKPLRVVAGGKK